MDSKTFLLLFAMFLMIFTGVKHLRSIDITLQQHCTVEAQTNDTK